VQNRPRCFHDHQRIEQPSELRVCHQLNHSTFGCTLMVKSIAKFEQPHEQYHRTQTHRR